jgi:hypothetical protein
MDYSAVDCAIDQLEVLSKDAIENPRLWKEIWTHIREIGTNFKSVRYPSAAQREAAWVRFQSTVRDVRGEQQQHHEKATEDERNLAQRLDALESDFGVFGIGRRDWKTIWNDLSAAKELMKTSNFLSRTSREELWGRFRKLSDKARDVSQAERKERQDKAARSESCKNEIIDMANSARPLSALENAIADLIITPARLVVEVATLGLLSQQIDERKEELKGCSAKLREAWTLFGERKDQLLPRDKQQAFLVLRDVQNILDEYWREWKRSHQRLHESKREAYETRREEAAARRAAFEERVNANLARLQGRLDRLRGVIEHKEQHLEELREKRDSAWNDDFRERVEGWIEEEERAIDDIRGKIDDIESWIQQEEEKLR